MRPGAPGVCDREMVLKRMAALMPEPIFLICLIGVVLVGLLDYATGYEVSLGPFYMVPITLAAALIRRSSGYLIATLCALAACTARLCSGNHYSSWGIFIWNSSMRLLVFLFVAFLVSKVSELHAGDARSREETLAPNGKSHDPSAGQTSGTGAARR